MKRIAALSMTMAMTLQTAMGAINCAPYAVEVKQAQDVVDNFERGLGQVRRRSDIAQTNLQSRQSLIGSASVQIANAQAEIENLNNSIRNENASIRNERKELNDFLIEKSNLEADIAQTEGSIQDLPGPRRAVPANRGSVTVRRGGSTVTMRTTRGRVVRPAPRSHARDVLVRKLTGLKGELVRLNAKIHRLEVRVNPVLASIANLQKSRAEQMRVLSGGQQDLNNAQELKPALDHLQRQANASLNELRGQDQIQAKNVEILAQAQERLLMCKTYTVKYPVALEEARKIRTRGCNAYRMPNTPNRPYVLDAATETFEALCK